MGNVGLLRGRVGEFDAGATVGGSAGLQAIEARFGRTRSFANAPRTLDPAEVSPNTQPRPGEETAPVTQRSPQSPPYTDPKIEVNFEGDPTPVQPQQPLPEPSMEPGPNSEPVKVEDPYAPTSATPGGPDTPVRNIEVPGGPAVPANDVIPESGVLGPQPPFEEQPVLAA